MEVNVILKSENKTYEMRMSFSTSPSVGEYITFGERTFAIKEVGHYVYIYDVEEAEAICEIIIEATDDDIDYVKRAYEEGGFDDENNVDEYVDKMIEDFIEEGKRRGKNVTAIKLGDGLTMFRG